MLSQTNDGWWLWAIRIELAAALILCSGIVQAQASQSKSSGCEMRLLDAPKPVYPPRQPQKSEVLESSVVVDLVVKEDSSIRPEAPGSCSAGPAIRYYCFRKLAARTQPAYNRFS